MLTFVNKNFYAPDKIILRNEKSGYFMDPNDVARRFIKLISLHDSVKNPGQINLSSTWSDIGIDELTYVEIMLEAENEFYLEFADEDVERFKNVEDVVEHVSRSFFAQ